MLVECFAIDFAVVVPELMNHAAAALALTEGQRLALEFIAKSTTAPHRDVVRVPVLLLAADGVANTRKTLH